LHVLRPSQGTIANLSQGLEAPAGARAPRVGEGAAPRPALRLPGVRRGPWIRARWVPRAGGRPRIPAAAGDDRRRAVPFLRERLRGGGDALAAAGGARAG